MKTKRRHELHTNALADWLGLYVEKARPYFGWLAGGGMAIIVLLLGWSYFSSRSQKQMYDGWTLANESNRLAITAINNNDSDKFQDAMKKLTKLVDDYSGSPLAAFAEASMGDLHLLRGQTLMWVQPSDARDKMRQAIGHYQDAIKLTSEPLLKNRLRLNLGTAHEWLFDLNEARKAYEQVDDGIYKQAAQQQLAALDQATQDKLFEKLDKYEPASASAPGRRPGTEFGSEFEDLGAKVRDLQTPNVRGEDLVPSIDPLTSAAQPTGEGAAAQPSGADR
jgi:tetratricopeptide (TPR) repeat protein